MALGKQAKTLTKAQLHSLLLHVANSRNHVRNRLIVLLSVRAGLRAKEIAHITWSMVLNSDGSIAQDISVLDCASKGASGRTIPMARDLRDAIAQWKAQNEKASINDRIITTKRTNATSAQMIVNLFADWYRQLSFIGCSSHSGRRTFITNAARKIATVGGSIRDVQSLAGHSSLTTTQRYIEINAKAKRLVVELL